MFSRVTECSVGLNYPYAFIHKIILFHFASVSVCVSEWMNERKYTRFSILISEAEVGLRFLSFLLWATGSLSLYCWQRASFSVLCSCSCLSERERRS